MTTPGADNSNPVDDLRQDVAVRRVSVMIATDGVIPAGKLEEIRTAAREYIASRGYSQGRVARKVATSGTYLSNFLSGSSSLPPETEQKLARAINDWMERDYVKRCTRVQQGYVETRVARRICKVVDQVCATGDIGVIVGPAGIGKTITLIHLARIIPGSLYIRCTSDSVRKTGFLRTLYHVVWERGAPNRPTLADALEALAGSDRLLILDQADDLLTETLKVIMDLHDVAGIPIILAGTNKLLAKLNHDRDTLRGQMASRVGIRADVLREKSTPDRRGRPSEWIRAEEIRKIFESPRIKLHPGTVAKLKDIANNQIGHLRRCERLVRYAQLLVPGAETATSIVITPEVLDQAIVLVDGGPPPHRPGAQRLDEAKEATA